MLVYRNFQSNFGSNKKQSNLSELFSAPSLFHRVARFLINSLLRGRNGLAIVFLDRVWTLCEKSSVYNAANHGNCYCVRIFKKRKQFLW